ncbi:MAG: hypothetical protein WC769_01460 [Thermodesulfovibrionales bacterium]|jgi:hypothetical protein
MNQELRMIKELIEEAREKEKRAEHLLSLALPPGTLVTFRFGNMQVNGNAEVIGTRVFHYPEVTIKNSFTGKTRTVPLDAINGF